MTRMDCAEVGDLLQPFADGELPTDERHAIALHLAGCSNCADALAELEALRSRVKRAGTHPLPPDLATRVRAKLAAQGDTKVSSTWRQRSMLAASHAVAAGLGGFLVYGLLTQADRQDRVRHDLISSHVRALMSGQPMQVASADPHTVRPWFSGRIPFSPPVKDLTAEGFPLLGARVDYVSPDTVAAMVYGRRMHRITLFVRPIAHQEPVSVSQSSRDGYNTVTWRDGAFRYDVVSDLNRNELTAFAKLIHDGSVN